MSLFFLTSCKLSALNNSKKNVPQVQLIVKSDGGDKNAALLLQKYLTTKNISTEIISSYEDALIMKKDVKYIFIGQGVSLEFIKNNNDITKYNKDIYFYMHIISPDVIYFINNNKNAVLITTASQKILNSNKISNNIISIPLAMPTYLKKDSELLYVNNKNKIDKLLSRPTIHLGGSYKNNSGADVLISSNTFKDLKSNLQISPSQEVSIIIHPRTFKDILNNKIAILERFRDIANHKSIHNTYFFVPNDLYQIVKENFNLFKDFHIELSPAYNAILYAINEINIGKQNYVSVDQYNAFSDIKTRVVGFLLNQGDIDQKTYLKYYNSLDLNKEILKDFLRILH
jgi:hypothetical protein